MVVSTATILVPDGPVALLRRPGDGPCLAPSLERASALQRVGQVISDHLLRAELARAHRGDVQDAEQPVQAEQGNAEDGANARLLEGWAHDLMVLEDECRRRMPVVLVAADTRLIPTV